MSPHKGRTALKSNALTETEQSDGWQLLFDGKSLDGWDITGKEGCWAVEDGTIVRRKSGGGYLYTQEQFEDFTLKLDFMFQPTANSGVILRWSDLADRNTGMEMQILDTFGESAPTKHSCGALYDLLAPSRPAVHPAEQWNTALVQCTGPIIRVRLNDIDIIEMDTRLWNKPGQNPDGSPNKFTLAWADVPRRGHLALQSHASRHGEPAKIWFRNVKILAV